MHGYDKKKTMTAKWERPVFLGLSTRTARHGYGWDLLGVTHALFCPFFPQSLAGLHCLLGINKNLLYAQKEYSYKLTFTDDNNPENQYWVTQEFRFQENAANTPSASEVQISSPFRQTSEEAWATTFAMGALANRGDEYGAYEIIPVPTPSMIINEPTTVSVDIEWDSEVFRLGRVSCNFVEPPPISEPERRAISSHPAATRAIVFEIGCKKCRENLRLYALLEPNQYPVKTLEQTAIYVYNAPVQWQCGCNHTNINLTYMKRGIHDLFRRIVPHQGSEGTVSFRPLYERGQLTGTFGDFQALIHSAPTEESVQNFMETHPVVWAFLSPIKILFKPSVLTQKKADFGILTSQNVLYLVEIEKPQTQLSTKDGGFHRELGKGIKQIRDWSLVVKKHWSALLDELEFSADEVQDIRYMLVAGLAHQVDREVLMKLQSNPPVEKTLFFCFDDLASFLHNLERHLEDL